MITLTINSVRVGAKTGETVLEAAQHAGIYIPRLCYHPDLPPAPGIKANVSIYRGGECFKSDGSGQSEFEGCKLCLTEIEGINGFPLACNTPVAEGMVVYTNTPRTRELQREGLAHILARHPHACLLCENREGCNREPCSLNVPVKERCCSKFGLCELQKVAESIGIKEDIPRYVHGSLPVEETPLFIRDHNLCISCNRCVNVCRNLRGIEALGYIYRGNEVILGTIGSSLKESECKFCGACVEVCPTGALMDRNVKWGQIAQRAQHIVPCIHNCPAGVDVPRYVHLISEGKYADAAAVIREKVPFPCVLGHVCDHPCETKCQRGKLNEPISIRELKRFAAEHDAELWKANFKIAPPREKRVAIVGAGPAGLTAAYELAAKGYSVTIFESNADLGGMLRVSIPEYRLPKDVLDAEIHHIKNLGIEVKALTPVGKDLTIADLQKKYDAVFIAVGSHASRELGIPGEELKGVIHGLKFLKEVKLGKKTELGNNVAVIGGGNVAIDAARVALRLGPKEVTILYRRSKEEMPANASEVKEAEMEGVKIQFLVAPKKILGEAGKVNSIECLRMTLGPTDESGRRRPIPVEGSEHKLHVETVILAIGEFPDLLLPNKIAITKQRTIKVNSATLETTLPGVFAGGDVVNGPSSVIEAIAMGRKTAASIDKSLGGDGLIDKTLISFEKPGPWLGREEGFADRNRVQMSHLPLEQRLQGFSVVELGFTEKEAVEEAKRCLRCDLRLQFSPVLLPPEKWLDFNPQNVNKVPETDGVFQLFDEKKMIILIAGSADLHKALQERLETAQKARYFIYEEHPMYTMRESELLQKFLKEHGKMPELNDELGDLF